jgi:hypothetical protein
LIKYNKNNNINNNIENKTVEITEQNKFEKINCDAIFYEAAVLALDDDLEPLIEYVKNVTKKHLECKRSTRIRKPRKLDF